MIEIDLELPPTTNKSFRVGKGRFYETPEYQNWKIVAGYKAKAECGHIPCDLPMKLTVEMYQIYGGDIDGRLKPLLDALNGIVYLDDKQVYELSVRKYKSKRAHCVVKYELPQLELFDGSIAVKAFSV